MKNYAILLVILIAIIFLGSVSLPSIFGQVSQVDTNVKVLSYSWYSNPAGDFIVVGEVQNVGGYILSLVSLNALVYASDGTEIVSGSTTAYASYLLPQQKAPFYIDFGNPGADSNSIYSSVSYVDFTVSNAPTTKDSEYAGLSLNPVFSGVVEGTYIVLGAINNIGNQTADSIRLVGTYYNSAGTVVAVGFNNINGSLTPNNSTEFTVSEFDATPNLVAQISNYSLLVQTSTLQNTLSASSPSPSSSSFDSSRLIYPVVVTVVIVVIAVMVLAFLKRRRNLPPPPPPPSKF